MGTFCARFLLNFTVNLSYSKNKFYQLRNQNFLMMQKNLRTDIVQHTLFSPAPAIHSQDPSSWPNSGCFSAIHVHGCGLQGPGAVLSRDHFPELFPPISSLPFCPSSIPLPLLFYFLLLSEKLPFIFRKPKIQPHDHVYRQQAITVFCSKTKLKISC